jgi:hypothetical protein
MSNFRAVETTENRETASRKRALMLGRKADGAIPDIVVLRGTGGGWCGNVDER